MARLAFIGFDYTYSGGTPSTSAAGTTNANGDIALPNGCQFVDYTSDTTFYSPGASGQAIYNCTGYDSNSAALGLRDASSNNYLNNVGSHTCLAVPSTVWNATTELFVHLRWSAASGSSNVLPALNTPATFERSEARWQVFKWGDLSVRLRSHVNATSTTGTVTFELFNGASSLGTVAATITHQTYIVCSVRAKLDGSTGRLDFTAAGTTGSYTGLNSTATTAFASVTKMYIGGGALATVANTGNARWTGCVDDILINDTAFEATKPYGRRLTIASDNTLSGWTAQGGAATVTGALSGTGTARGTNSGSYATLNPSTFSATGLTNVIGYFFVPGGVKNMDANSTKKLKVGMDNGSVYYDTQISAQIPAFDPTTGNLVPGYLFYAGGTTDFDLTNAAAASIKLRLECSS